MLITPLDDQGRSPKDWPTARELTTILRRRAPSLRRLGWTVEETAKDPRARAVRFQLIPPLQDRRRGVGVARNARTQGVPAGQQGWWGASEGASDNAGCERRASDDARSSSDARTLARTRTPPLSSPNGVIASVASDTSDIYASPPLTGCATPQPDGVEP
jgi:hypothetical protein